MVRNKNITVKKGIAVTNLERRKRIQLSFKPKKPALNKQTNTLRQIRFYQRLPGNLLLKLPFIRLVRDLTFELNKKDVRYTKTSLDLLQTMTEIYVVRLVEDSNLCAMHAGRVTLMNKDLVLVLKIKGDLIYNMSL